MDTKTKVGILGATGAVGQRFVQLLENHPWFELSELGASEKSAGKIYKDAVLWKLETAIPHSVKKLFVKECKPELFDCSFVFSGLDSEVAGDIETAFADNGIPVISNSKNHRFDENVPLLIADINPEHIEILDKDKSKQKGFIVTNPNCSAVGLASALKPLMQFGLSKIIVTTMQALSGAGYPGVSAVDIIDNVIPFISGEEGKLEIEPKKILGSYQSGKFIDADMTISAHCNRVNVKDGHLECVSVKLEKKVAEKDIIKAWTEYKSEISHLHLPSFPKKSLIYKEECDRPQPRYDKNEGHGMTVTLGRLRKCPLLSYKFIVLSHNTIKGAAGIAILNAELLKVRGYIE